MTRNILIGVAGGTASGKTTIAEILREEIGSEHALLITLDDYYRRLEGDLEQRRQTNFDHPDAFDWTLLEQHLGVLLEGGTVDAPRYDHSVSQRREQSEPVESRPVIMVEGILALWNGPLRDLMDIKVFVDAPADLRLARRLRRDLIERKRTPDSVLTQYEQQVRPMHQEFCEPTKEFADVIIPRGSRNRVAIDMVVARLVHLLDPVARQRLQGS